jgi:acetoin utilization deacetylase AcuC-like enzyme
MLIIGSDAHRAHHPRRPFYDRGVLVQHPEVPERADRIVTALDETGLGAPVAPHVYGLAPIERVHAPEYVAFLAEAHERWCEATGLGPESEAAGYARAIHGQPSDVPPNIIGQLGWYSHDNDTVAAGTWSAAAAAVDVTLTAWEAVAGGDVRSAYALARPPGHHAAADSFAGYCYLNNVAIAAQAWVDRGARVAVLDVDFHHGNGTQQIFYDRDDVLFVSVHADPADDYPFFLGFASERGWGAGEDCTRNFPLPAGTEWDAYGPALDAACAVIRKYRPDGLLVSLGVDTALEDPDSFRLVADDYPRIGAAVAALDLPTVVVQEGGYNLDVIGRNVAAVLHELA